MHSRSGLAVGWASNRSATMRRGLVPRAAGGQAGNPWPHWVQDRSLAITNASGTSRAARSRTAATASSYGLRLVVTLAVAWRARTGARAGASRVNGSPARSVLASPLKLTASAMSSKRGAAPVGLGDGDAEGTDVVDDAAGVAEQRWPSLAVGRMAGLVRPGVAGHVSLPFVRVGIDRPRPAPARASRARG